MRTRIALGWALAAVVVAGALFVVWVATLPGGADDAAMGDGGAAMLAASWAVIGALLLTARPGNAVGWLFVLSGLFQAWSNVGSAYGGYGVGVANPMWPLADWVAQSATMIYLPSLVLPVTVILAVYPDGRLPSRRWRLPVAAVALGLVVVTIGGSLDGEAYDDVAPGPAPLEVSLGWWDTPIILAGAALLIGGALAIWVMTGFRLARARPPERPLLAWYVATVVPAFLGIFGPDFGWLGLLLIGLSIPVAIAVGVLRYRMLDIVLRPAIVYGLLTLAVVAVYVAVTAWAGWALDRGPLPGVIAAALVAVALTPARVRLQRGADRFVYGERQDPIRAVAALGSRVASAGEDALLDAVVASVADAVRAAGVLVRDRSGVALATHGNVSDVAVSLPLVVAGREVGVLAVAARSTGGQFSAADLRVVAALAPQVAVVVHALDLADALQVQRDRVVAATRIERDRLRRELHDGLGPALSGTALGLQATADALDRGRAEEAERLVSRMRSEVDVAVADIRRIIDGLRPADLDDGLELAVRRRAAAVDPAVHVEVAVGHLPPLPPEVESAAYRIAGEALTNVVRHARAQHARVALAASDGALTVRISDDGSGIRGDANTAGVGLASMRRRAETLGGTLELDSGSAGTAVTATLPL